MFRQIVESLSSKVAEKLVEYGLDTVRDKTNYKSTLDTLKWNLESLSAIASDVEEEIKSAELLGQRKRKRKREVEDWLNKVEIIRKEFQTLESEVKTERFIKQFFGEGRAAELNAKVKGLIDQRRQSGGLLLDVDKTKGEALLTTRLVGKAFEENLERILKYLSDDGVSSIGIYGMGGVGKTTLAKHINNRLLEESKKCVFWVIVSHEFSIKTLQDEIAHVVGIDLSGECNEEKRAARLNRAFSSLRKKFVLILDDVWNNIDLERVGNPLRVEGGKLMITSRSEQVCHQICGEVVIPVKTLGRDEAWKLFSETVGPKITLNPQVEEIARHMAKVCDGLPLGIITVAGSMKGETDIHVWGNALEELKEHVMRQDDQEDKVFKVLKYSFDRLDQREEKSNGYTKYQKCFLHCSLYPEDYLISIEELIHKFISEELVDKRKNRTKQFDEGRSILHKLVKVSLLEKFSDEHVKMHDLVRDMALKITKGKYMVVDGHYSLKEMPNEEEWSKDLEKMSLMRCAIEEIPDEMSPNCPKLSTLLWNGSFLKSIPDSFFWKMHGLCTLDMSDSRIKELPNSVSDLENLKALLLGCCWELVYVPYLGKLKALMELDLSDTAIEEVPQGLGNLVNLKCLKLSYQIQALVEEIKRMIRLEEFWGRVKYVGDFNRFIRYRRSQNRYINYRMVEGICEHWQHPVEKEVIVGHESLKKDVCMLVQDVQHLRFDKCEGLSNCLLDDFPKLNNHSLLEYLYIGDCEGIECILTKEQLKSSCIPSLENLFLRKLPDFRGIIKSEVGAVVASSPPPQVAVFSSLRSLFIYQCNKVTNLGLPISELQNLEYINIRECDEIQEIIEAADDSGRPEGEAVVVPLPKLKEMRLLRLPRLKSICKATMNCSSIEKVELKGCKALQKLPLFFALCIGMDGQPYYDQHPPPSFKRILAGIDEKEWWESLEWELLSYKDLLQSLVEFYG